MLGEKPITSAQCRAARALLGWSREDLAAASSVSKMTLADFETGKRNPYPRTLVDIRDAFRVAGVAFIDAGADLQGSGVRFASPDDCSTDLDKVPAAIQLLRRQ